MAMIKFAKAIMAGEPIDVYNYGKHRRDFTYIDDIVEGVVRALDHVAEPNPAWQGDAPDPGSSTAPWRVYNIGSNSPVELLDYIEALESALGRSTTKNLLPMQPGDVPDTYADVDDLVADLGYRPSTPIDVGVAKFAEWFKSYYGHAA
jgi:UDP-glucuronate 4-epimerase